MAEEGSAVSGLKGGVRDDDGEGGTSVGKSVKVAERAVWDGNVNVYWVVGTLLGLWFLLIDAPRRVHEHREGMDAAFVLHMVGAYATYLICIWNMFHTPSHGTWYREWHIFLGRVVLFAGVFHFAFGLYCAWADRPGREIPSELSIGLTVGGIMQTLSAFLGYICISSYRATPPESWLKSWLLRGHIAGMAGVFLPSCGTPAAMRIMPYLGQPMWLGLAVFIPILTLMSFRVAFLFEGDDGVAHYF